MKKNKKDQAIQKLHQDILKKINVAIDIAKNCGLIEILMAVMDYHFRRIRTVENKTAMPDVQSVEAFINMDSIKYVIQLILKFGKTGQLNGINMTGNNVVQAWNRYIDLRTRANTISYQNELFGLLELCPDVNLIHENLIRSDMSELPEEAHKLLEYGARADYLNNIKKENILSADDYFNCFLEEVKPYNDLYRDSLFAQPEEIVKTYKTLFDDVTKKIAVISREFKHDKNDIVYPYDMVNMVRLLPCFMSAYKNVLEMFKNTTGLFINAHTISKEDIDVYNLQFYQLSRKPFINVAGILVISPELVLESMLIDSHYSLLETPYAKDEYKTKTAELFLTKITAIATKYGFEEQKREYDLLDGKRNIGDLDLILRKNDFYLIVEAKNHSLPLEVYFHDLQATKKHLDDLRKNWIKHVVERREYVKKHHSELDVGDNFNYVVVSKFPEPISHFSDVPCFAIEEFEKWLEYGNYKMSFEDFYKKFYEDDKIAPSLKDMKNVQKRLHPNIWFGKQ